MNASYTFSILVRSNLRICMKKIGQYFTWGPAQDLRMISPQLCLQDELAIIAAGHLATVVWWCLLMEVEGARALRP